jgi:hypothetical protein
MMGKPVVAAGDQRVIRGEAEFALYSITTLFLTQHVHTTRTAHAARFWKRFLEQDSVRVNDKIIYKNRQKCFTQ